MKREHILCLGMYSKTLWLCVLPVTWAISEVFKEREMCFPLNLKAAL